MARVGPTRPRCGGTDNGFGLLFNWNLLEDGEHDVEFGRATVRVTTLGVEFLRDVTGTCEAADFPLPGETAPLAWQQSSQNFVLAAGPAPTEAIVARAGVTRGALHYHFQNKAGLFSAVYTEMEGELLQGVVQSMAAAEGDEWQRILWAIDTFLEGIIYFT